MLALALAIMEITYAINGIFQARIYSVISS